MICLCDAWSVPGIIPQSWNDSCHTQAGVSQGVFLPWTGVVFSAAGDIGYLSKLIGAAGVVFRQTPGDYHYSWHNAPQRQFIVNLDADVEVEVCNGEKRLIRQGEVFFVEDTTGVSDVWDNLIPGTCACQGWGHVLKCLYESGTFCGAWLYNVQCHAHLHISESCRQFSATNFLSK